MWSWVHLHMMTLGKLSAPTMPLSPSRRIWYRHKLRSKWQACDIADSLSRTQLGFVHCQSIQFRLDNGPFSLLLNNSDSAQLLYCCCLISYLTLVSVNECCGRVFLEWFLCRFSDPGTAAANRVLCLTHFLGSWLRAALRDC